MTVIAGNRKGHHGFTLIELLVTIAVVAILATLAVPGFQNLMATNRQASDYNEILAALNYSRSEAVKRRQEVTFQISDSSGLWSLLVHYDHDDDGVSDEALLERQARDDRLGFTTNTVTFNSLGRLESCTTLTDGDCSITIGDSSVVVSPAGSIAKGGGVIWGIE
ncbi:GspH/FimT family pseudopilin [Halomonas sp. H5]|uniref:GspH/FimT family pseudopilin n=1 Tax=Halomonas sp. H5 TaxID=3423910 RepID=UPI003D368AF7